MATPDAAPTALETATAALERPFTRWLRRQQAEGGSALEAQAACVLIEELRCARVLCEALAPGRFTPVQRLRLRRYLFEAKALVAPETAVADAAEALGRFADATKPLGHWLLGQAQMRATLAPEAAQHLATDAVAAVMVYDTFVCARDVTRDDAAAGEGVTLDAILDAYEALMDHQERIQDEGKGDDAEPATA